MPPRNRTNAFGPGEELTPEDNGGPPAPDPWANLRKSAEDEVLAQVQDSQNRGETATLLAVDDRPLLVYRSASTSSSHTIQKVLDEAVKEGYTHVEAITYVAPWFHLILRRDA